MRKLQYIMYIVLLDIIFLSCQKEANSVKTIPNSAITIINAVVNSNPVITDITGAGSVAAYFSTTPKISYGSFYEFSIPNGAIPVAVYQTSDTISPLYKNKLILQPDSIYSLFLSGTINGHNQADSFLTIDHPPYHSSTDSTVGVRFVNLSPGSSPISVNMQGGSNGSEVSTLSYQHITEFKIYAATQNITQYTFEIRDAVSGNLLTTYTYTIAPFQNITIAIIGQEDPSATVPISVMQINNF